jgi:large subunit ribosomal protein L19
MGELSACVTVRRIASGIGVEKTFLLHSPNVSKIEIVRRAKVRRNFLSFLRERRGKSARLKEVPFDRAAVNASNDVKPIEEDPLDAEVTEINEELTEQVAPEVSIEQEIKEENTEAAADDDTSPVENPDEGEENELAGEEAQEGVDRAESETNKE